MHDPRSETDSWCFLVKQRLSTVLSVGIRNVRFLAVNFRSVFCSQDTDTLYLQGTPQRGREDYILQKFKVLTAVKI
jgi:hypothetical protein